MISYFAQSALWVGAFMAGAWVCREAYEQLKRRSSPWAE